MDQLCFLTVEDDAAYLYYSCYNSRLYHEKEPQGVEFDIDVAPAIEYLLKNILRYAWVKIGGYQFWSKFIRKGKIQEQIEFVTCFTNVDGEGIVDHYVPAKQYIRYKSAASLFVC